MEPHAALAQVEGEKMTVWASTQNPFGRETRSPGDRVPAGKRPRHHALRRRRLRRKDGQPAGRRGGQAGQGRRQAGPGGLEPGRGVLLRHLPAGGGRQDQVGDRRRGQDRALGLPRLLGRASEAPSSSTTSRTTDPDVRSLGQRHAQDAPLRHRCLARAGQQHQHLRPRIADRHDGGEGQGRSARIPPEQPPTRE